MINVVTSDIVGAYTKGFGVKAEAFSVVFEKGSITFVQDKDRDGVISASELERYTFPSFMFDVVPDPELDVLYDIYLCGDSSIAVERIELLPEIIPFYTGDKELLHQLGSVIVPAGASTSDELKIEVRLLNLVVKEQ
jgi:hypothetical protein